MSKLTRDGTAEPVSRDQIIRGVRGQGNIHFPCSADHAQDWQPYPLIHTLLYVMTIGALREVAARGWGHCRGEPSSAISGWYALNSARAEGSSIVDEPGEC